MLLLDVTIVIVAQPAIQTRAARRFSDVQWTLDAYALTLASLLLTSGSLADRYGRKLLFPIGLVVFTLGSLLCGLAARSADADRVAQRPGGRRRDHVRDVAGAARATASAAASAGWRSACGARSPASSTALGPVLGGVITTDWGWRGIFLVNVPIGVFALARDRLAGRGVAVAAPRAAGLGRVRAAHRRAGQPGLRADQGRRELLVGHRGDRLPGRRRGAAGRVRRGREPGRAPDVRPVAAARRRRSPAAPSRRSR